MASGLNGHQQLNVLKPVAPVVKSQLLEHVLPQLRDVYAQEKMQNLSTVELHHANFLAIPVVEPSKPELQLVKLFAVPCRLP